jgi:hypothetical protein
MMILIAFPSKYFADIFKSTLILLLGAISLNPLSQIIALVPKTPDIPANIFILYETVFDIEKLDLFPEMNRSSFEDRSRAIYLVFNSWR